MLSLCRQGHLSFVIRPSSPQATLMNNTLPRDRNQQRAALLGSPQHSPHWAPDRRGSYSTRLGQTLVLRFLKATHRASGLKSIRTGSKCRLARRPLSTWRQRWGTHSRRRQMWAHSLRPSSEVLTHPQTESEAPSLTA